MPPRGVEADISFHLLEHLVDVPVQDGHRTEPFEVTQRLLSPPPDVALLEKADQELVHRTLETLPVEYREVLVMRELEGLSYKETADIAELPIGTVMSRLARAREHLRQGLLERLQKD